MSDRKIVKLVIDSKISKSHERKDIQARLKQIEQKQELVNNLIRQEALRKLPKWLRKLCQVIYDRRR
jgi:hypothetical protein